MHLRFYWRDCTYRDHSPQPKAAAAPVDAFWVEATPEEAVTRVFPLLPQASIAESRRLAESYSDLAAMIGDATRPFCFLVARDLSFIAPRPPHYPVHHMWNAYSPFEAMPVMDVESLEELGDIALPPGPP